MLKKNKGSLGKKNKSHCSITHPESNPFAAYVIAGKEGIIWVNIFYFKTERGFCRGCSQIQSSQWNFFQVGYLASESLLLHPPSLFS